MGGPLCTICGHVSRADINADIAAGRSGMSLAKSYAVSLPSLYRHIRSGHAQPATLALQQHNGSPSVPTLAPIISATLRDVQRLAREAQRHLKVARQADDHKATNGAITAAAKALELVGKLRGELQHGANVNVNIGVEAKVAMDLRSQADALHADEVTEQARSWLAVQVEAGDADAVRAVLALVRMVPGADAT
jgi:hypothetical protein